VHRRFAYWSPGVNNLKQYGRWAFAEFTDVYEMQTDFAENVEQKFDEMIETLASSPNSVEALV
jgi:type III restriction enzyme